MSTPVLPDYTAPFKPVPMVTPFTIRDNDTMLKKVEYINKYIRRILIPWINVNFSELADAFEEQVNLLIEQVNTALATQSADVDAKIDDLTTFVNTEITSMQTYVDNAVDSIINSTIEVSDPVILGVFETPGNNSLAFLDNRFPGFGVNEFNAKWFGAIGNNIADDTAALQDALDTAGSSLSKTLFIPPGEYRFTILNVPSGVTVRGVRGATKLRVITDGIALNQGRLLLLDVSDVTLRDFTIGETAPVTRGGSYGVIGLDNAKRVLIDNVEVDSSSKTAVHGLRTCEYITITNCEFHGTLADGIHFQRGSKHINIIGNRVYDTGDDAIGFVSHAVNESGVCRNIVISGNILGPTVMPGDTTRIGAGIALIGIVDATVVGNTIQEVGSGGIRISSISEAEGFAVAGNILIEGNRIMNVGQYDGATTTLRDGVSVYNSRNVTITGNIIDNPVASGIAVSQCNVGITVTNNDILRAGATAIFGALLERDGDWLEIWTRPEFDDGQYHDYVGLHDLLIADNRITSPAASGITVQGVSTRYAEGVTIVRNTVKRPNMGDTASRYGIFCSLAEQVDISFNSVGRAVAENVNATTRLSTSSIREFFISQNTPAVDMPTTQQSIVGKNVHQTGPTPNTGTWEISDVQWNQTPNVGNVSFWTCRQAGTLGTLNSGATTGTIDGGDTLLELSTLTGLRVPAYVSIAGVAGTKKIIEVVDDNVVRIDSPADVGVISGAIAYVAPVFSSGPVYA